MQMLHHLYKDLNISRLRYLWGSWKQSLMLPKYDCITIYGDGGTLGTKENRTLLFIKTALPGCGNATRGNQHRSPPHRSKKTYQRCKVDFVSMFLSLRPVWRPAFPQHLSTPSRLLRGTAHSDEDGNWSYSWAEKSESYRPISQGPVKRQNSHQLLL